MSAEFSKSQHTELSSRAEVPSLITQAYEALRELHRERQIFVAGIMEEEPLLVWSAEHVKENKEDGNILLTQYNRTSFAISPRGNYPLYEPRALDDFAKALQPIENSEGFPDSYVTKSTIDDGRLFLPQWHLHQEAITAQTQQSTIITVFSSIDSEAEEDLRKIVEENAPKDMSLNFSSINCAVLTVYPSPAYAKVARIIELDEVNRTLDAGDLTQYISLKDIEGVKKEQKKNWTGGLEVVHKPTWLLNTLGLQENASS